MFFSIHMSWNRALIRVRPPYFETMFFPSFSKTTPFFFHGKSPQNFPRHPGPWTKSSRSLNMWSWPRTWHGCLFKVAHGLKDFLPGIFSWWNWEFCGVLMFFLSEWDRIWACPGTGFQEIPFMDFSGWIFTFCVCPQSLQHMLFGPSMNRYELQGVVVSCKSYVFPKFWPHWNLPTVRGLHQKWSSCIRVRHPGYNAVVRNQIELNVSNQLLWNQAIYLHMWGFQVLQKVTTGTLRTGAPHISGL